MATGAMAATLAACSSAPHDPPPSTTSTSSTTTTAPAAAAALCPLTGAPVPGGGPVPARAALAVKVDNYPDARPQSGLDKADIVFEEPVEGGITRYVAVFQCQAPALVGPVRSARNIDIGILGQFGSPLLVHVGGIPPVLSNIEASPLINLDLGAHGSLEQHPAGRVAPYDTYTSTSALWYVEQSHQTPPTPVFSYSTTVPLGTPVSSVAIPFSGTSNVLWHYSPKLGLFQRYYGLSPDIGADGKQNTAANVIVQFVQISYGPWVENSEGGLEVQANLYGASGLAKVFRSGVEIDGTWQRSSLSSPTQFLDNGGQPIALQPGQTWVELVPSGIPVSALPPPSATATTAPAAPA